MQTVVLDPGRPAEAVLAAVGTLQRGGVIAAPTETVYGLMTRWDNPEGKARILGLKQRGPEKQFQVLVTDLDMALVIGVVRDRRLEALARRFWPGPLTIVCLTTGGDTLGLRSPNHPYVLQLLACLGQPLTATSANLSGMPPARTAAEAIACLCGQPDLLVDGGPTGDMAASTVVSLAQTTGFEILRRGPVPEEALAAALACRCPGGGTC